MEKKKQLYMFTYHRNFYRGCRGDTEALNINFASLGKNIAEENMRQNVCSYSYLGILFAAAKTSEIRRLHKSQFLFLRIILNQNFDVCKFS